MIAHLISLGLNIIISEEVEGWDLKAWLDGFNEIIGVLTVDHPVEHWLEVTLTDSHEVDVDNMPGVEHDWGDSWVQPFLVSLLHVEGLDGSLDEGTLMGNDNLVLFLLGDLLPVVLNLLELISIDDLMHVLSDANDLWDLVLDVELHGSELVVLLVEGNPLLVVDIDLEGLVWLSTHHLGVLSGGLLECHMGGLNLVHLSKVDSLDLLDLLSWSLLLEGLDELDEGNEFLGVDKSLNLTLELLTVLGVGHHLLVFLAFNLESFSVLLKSHNLLLLEGDLEQISSLLEVLDGGGGGDSGDSGEFVHLIKKYLLIIII